VLEESLHRQTRRGGTQEVTAALIEAAQSLKGVNQADTDPADDPATLCGNRSVAANDLMEFRGWGASVMFTKLDGSPLRFGRDCLASSWFLYRRLKFQRVRFRH
jgi:hypothetical protein